MSACDSVGSRDYKMLVKAGASPHDFSSGAERYFPLSSSLKKSPVLINSPRLRGSYDQDAADYEQGSYDVVGDIVLDVGRGELLNWLPRILFTTAGSPFVPGVLFDANKFGILETVGPRQQVYKDLLVNRAVFRCPPRGQVSLTLSMIGRESVEDASDSTAWYTGATVVSGAAARVMMMKEAALTLDAVTTPMDEYTLTIDNKLEANFRGSEYANCVDANDVRMITLATNKPFNATTEPLLDKGLTNIGGSLIHLTGDGMSTSFVFGALKYAAPNPDTPGRGRVPFPLTFNAVKNGATPALTVTVDATP